jgi:microcystin-dependent protein
MNNLLSTRALIAPAPRAGGKRLQEIDRGKIAVAIAALFASWLVPAMSGQEASPLIPFQGILTNQSGDMVEATAPRSLVFRLYEVSIGGAPFWEEAQPGVAVIAGRFSVLLGSRSRLPSAERFTSTIYLGITIDDSDPATADIEMRPRQALVPIVSSQISKNALTLKGRSWSDLLTTGDDPSANGAKIRRDKLQLAFDSSSFSEEGSSVRLKEGGVRREQLSPDLFTELNVPPGTVVAFAGSVVPTGWLECNGASIPQGAEFQRLRDVLGGSILPDLQGRYVLGAGQGTGLTTRTLKQPIGSETKQLELKNLPPHEHDVLGAFHPDGALNGGGLRGAANSAGLASGNNWGSYFEYAGSRTTLTPSSGPEAFDIMPPSLVLKYIIRY